MKALKIIDGDICFDESNKMVMTEGAAEIAQALERRFTTNAGEWFLNGCHGLEYEKIREKGVSDEAVQMAVIKTATQDSRVKEVVDIDIKRDRAKRHININFTCKLVSGEKINVPFSF